MRLFTKTNFLRLSISIIILIVLQHCMITLFPDQSSPEFLEHIIEGRDTDKILVINIEGIITEYPSSGGILGLNPQDSIVPRITEELNRAKEDPHIKGIILKVNSPGGTVTASDILYREIKEFKNRTNLPILSLFFNTAASGAYYLSMASDYIVAHPTTVTGSVGVVMRGFNFKEGMDKIGVKEQTFASGANKNIGSPFSEMTPEHKKILQSIIDGLYDKFFDVVRKGRSKVEESKLKSLCDGRIFTSAQAKEYDLIDRIGYFDDAVKSLMTLPKYKKSEGNSNPKIITYTKSKKRIRNIYQLSNLEIKDIESSILPSILNSQIKPGFYYLWSIQ